MHRLQCRLCRFFMYWTGLWWIGLSSNAFSDYLPTPLIQAKIEQCPPLSDRVYTIDQVTSDITPSLVAQTDLEISVHSSVITEARGNVTGWRNNVAGGVLSGTSERLWEVNAQLSSVEQAQEQRIYDQLATKGRYIQTWLDHNDNKSVDDGEIVPFLANSFMGSAGYLNVDILSVPDLVNRVRSQKMLGVIAGGALVISGQPGEDFDRRFHDDSYARFRAHYKNRRHMVYAGSNDGMLHGINAGFWQEKANRYTTAGLNKELEHPLGAEVWAWMPMNGLPHLSSHTGNLSLETVLMDGQLQLFDVNIFPDDSDHPGGWGTILVAGMGLAAEPVNITVSGSIRTTGSAYIILDVTNPEKPPQLIAEITHPQLGFTTGAPVVLKQRQKSAENGWLLPVHNNWYLVLGSGPRGNDTAAVRRTGSSDQHARLFIYDLVKRQFVQGLSPVDTQWEQGHIGDMVVHDNDQDYKDDTVLFGVTIQKDMNSTSGFQGGVGAFVVKDHMANAYSVPIMQLDNPVDGRLFIQKTDNDGWLYGGTGRLLAPDDLTLSRENELWGMRWQTISAERYDTVNIGQLMDVTDISVFADGTIRKKIENDYAPFVVQGKTVLTQKALNQWISEYRGWRYRLKTPSNHYYNEIFNGADNRMLSYIVFRTRISGKKCFKDISSVYLKHFRNGLGLPDGVTVSTHTVNHFVPSQPDSVSEELLSFPSRFSYVINSLNSGKPVVIQQKTDSLHILQGGIEHSFIMDQIDKTLYGRQSWLEILNIP